MTPARIAVRHCGDLVRYEPTVRRTARVAMPQGDAGERLMSAAKAQAAAIASKAVEWIARIGYAAKGVVYGAVGVLGALAVVDGNGGQTTGPAGAMRAMGSEAFGWIPLTLAAFGMACYVAWCMIRAILDPGHNGWHAGGLFRRAVYLIAGIIYAGLTFLIVRMAVHVATGTIHGAGHSKDAMAARVMTYPGGLWALVALGTVIAGVGIAQFMIAYQEQYKHRWHTRVMSAAQQRWAGAIAKFGLAARGIVFLICGGFLIAAGWQATPDEATGLGGALNKLSQQSYGGWLLALAALGLICYGAYCMIDAVFARINP